MKIQITDSDGSRASIKVDLPARDQTADTAFARAVQYLIDAIKGPNSIEETVRALPALEEEFEAWLRRR